MKSHESKIEGWISFFFSLSYGFAETKMRALDFFFHIYSVDTWPTSCHVSHLFGSVFVPKQFISSWFQFHLS